MNKLSIEQIQANLANPYFPADKIHSLLRQLVDVMRENERLRDALGDLHALYAETDRTLDAEEVCGRVQELLYFS